MGMKKGAKRLPNSTHRPHNPISLREEVTGKLQKKATSNVKSILKLDHLRNLAVWASGEASIPSLGAFYGQCLASGEEAMGVPPDSSLITCQRCEIVLHPGFNCTIRIEKKNAKSRRRRKKFADVCQNNVVYKCHYCSHQNLKRGTPKGHMKGLCPSKDKSSVESQPRKTMLHESARLEKDIISKDEDNERDTFASRVAATDVPIIDSPMTPPLGNLTTALLEGNKRKRNNSLATKKAIEPASLSAKNAGKTAGSSSKRRRKSWTSLKEIAQSSERNSLVSNVSIPFFL